MSPVLFFYFSWFLPHRCCVSACYHVFYVLCPIAAGSIHWSIHYSFKESLNASKPLFLRLSPVFVYEVNSNACVLLGDFVYALLSPILEFSSSCPCLQTYFSVVLHRLLSSRILFWNNSCDLMLLYRPIRSVSILTLVFIQSSLVLSENK